MALPIKIVQQAAEFLFPFLKVLCAPYSIPLGLINVMGIYTFDTCYQESEKLNKPPEEYDEITDRNTIYSNKQGISTPDVTMVNDTSIIVNQILNKYFKNVQVTTLNVQASNRAVIENTFNQIEGAEFLQTLVDDNDVALFHCPTSVHQVVNIETYSFESITNSDKEAMVNDIQSHVETELKANGVDDGSIDIFSENTTKIKNSLVQNIDRTMFQINRNNIRVNQNLKYIDRYGRCDSEGRGKVLKQIIDIRGVVKNIINSSISMMMTNEIKSSSKMTVVVDRIQNYRIIFLSLIWNIIMLYLCFKLLQMMFSRFTG